MKHTELPNNCWCSKLTVQPANWKKCGSIAIPWRVSYRFYDPNVICPTTGRVMPKLMHIRSMNKFATYHERKVQTTALIDQEQKLLLQGYNPWQRKINVAHNSYDAGEMCLGNALQLGFDKLRIEPHTKEDIKSVLKYVTIAMHKANLFLLTVKNIHSGHIRSLLDICEEIKPKWSNNLFNAYCKYLSILFKELCELKITFTNPVRDIAKRPTEKHARLVPTDDEMKMIDSLQSSVYNFWRFIRIFFESGSRETELMSLQAKNVNLEEGYYTVTIKKGRFHRKVKKAITESVLHLWRELLKDAQTDYFVFSTGLQPGKNRIRTEQVTRRWERHVKAKLGIEADLYSMKHKYATRVSEKTNHTDAARMMGHTSTAMVVKIYDVNMEKRELERLRAIYVGF